MEQWKDISKYPGYQVSNEGRIWSERNQTYLKPLHNGRGYYEVFFRRSNGKQISERIHRLVALEFVDKPEGCNIVNHLDGNKLNNHSSNLEWTTIKGNCRHAYDNNLGNIQQNLKKASLAGADKLRQTIEVYKDNSLIGTFYGQLSCAEAINLNVRTIYTCIREDRQSKNGYSFVIIKGGPSCK